MKHAKSNKNLVKKHNGENNRKTNIFIKSSGYQNFKTIKTTNSKIRQNYLLSLLGKKTPKNLNLNKFDLNKKNKNNNIKKEIYLTSGFENLNKNKKNKEIKEKPIQRNINIRLNLNSEIINNNFGNCFWKNQNYHKSMSSINMNEKIKEKDKLITKLQTELLQLQEFLNQLQKDKEKELYSTYNTIKNIDNFGSNFYNNSLTALLNVPAILKFNKSNQKIRNNLNINKNKSYNFYTSFNTNKSNFKSKHNFIRSFSTSSSPRFIFPHKLDNVDSYNNNFPIKSLSRKKDKNLRINYISNPNIAIKKNYNFPPTKPYFSKQLSFSDYDYENYNFNNSNNFSEINYMLFDKCEKLKKRTKTILNKYNILINESYNKCIEKEK